MKNEIIVFYPGLRGYDTITKLRRPSRTEPTVTWRVIMKKISKLSRSAHKNLKAKSKSIHRYIKRWFSKKRNRRMFIYAISVLTIAGLLSGLVSYHAYSESKERKYEYILRERASKLESLHKDLQTVQEQKAVTETELQQKASTEAELKSEIDKLKRDLQAKRHKESLLAKARKAIVPTVSASPARVAPVPTGSGCEWLKGRLLANGVASSDIPAAINIASRESGCNPNAVNRKSGACNVFQELACGKWGGRSNVDAHIRGADGYAKGTYGGWWGAWKAWQSKKWW